MREYSLSNLISIKHGFAFSGNGITENDNGIVLVTPGNFKIGGGFQQEKCKFFQGEYPADYVLKTGDYIVTMTDLSKAVDTLGYSAIVPFGKRIYLHNQRIGLVKQISDDCDIKYLYWLMRTHDYQKYIANNSTGATVHHTSPNRICSYNFFAPDKNKQQKIADILSAYDNLIENNQKQIKLLEEAAQRLYKEWFVDFRFPDYETTEFIDGLPIEWKKASIANIADYVNGYAFKPSDWYKEGMPIIKIKEMNHGVTNSTPRNSGKSIPHKFIIRSGDILFSWSATLTAIIWSDIDGLLNQHLFKVIPKDFVSKEFVFQSIIKSLVEFGNLTTGATMKHIQRNKLNDVVVNFPNRSLMNEYANIAETLRYKILNLQKQIIYAQNARDALLPKLMCGELEV